MELDKNRLLELFETFPRKSRYESLDLELSDVATGGKGMSSFLFGNITLSSDEDYVNISNVAAKYSLVLSTVSDSETGSVRVLATHPQQTWRISALKILTDVVRQYRWGPELEMIESLILGYSLTEATDWASERRRRTAGYNGLTIFIVLDEAEVNELNINGRKSIRSVRENKILAFYNRDVGVGGDSVLKSDFAASIPPKQTLCRCSINLQAWMKLFESSVESHDSLLIGSIDETNCRTVNEGLLSSIESFMAEIFHSQRP